MTTPRENSTRGPLSTADLAAASRRSQQVNPDPDEMDDANVEQDDSRGDYARQPEDEALEPLFAADQAESYRKRWTAIQSSFVDDPSAAVRAGDELVAQVMSELANSFAEQRRRFESQLGNSGSGNTEDLRVAFRSYRSFFDRLLSL